MKSIPYSLFNTYERFLLLQLVVKFTGKYIASTTTLQPIYDRLMAYRNQMEQAMYKEKGSAYTEQLQRLDEQQDHGFLCLRYHVVAGLYNISDTSVGGKAKKIEDIIRRHGWSLFSFGYQKQLAVSRSLIAELKKPENDTLISDLELNDVFDAWSNAVNQFEQLFTQKVEASSTAPTKVASELGKEVVDMLEKLLPGWYYQAEFGSDANYKELVDQIMEGAGDIETQARARETRRKNQKEAEVN